MKNPWTMVTRFIALGLGILAILLLIAEQVGLDKLPFYFQLSAVFIVFGGSFGFTAFAHSPAAVLMALADVVELRSTSGPEALERSARVFQTLGEIAVPVAWAGVLLGWISMLQNLSDPREIGAPLSLALVSALYGFLLRAAFCIPCRDMLRERAKEAGAS